MQVLAEGRAAWFLFDHEDELYLDVNCSHGAAGYSVLLPLDDEERTQYRKEGYPFLDRLAQEVQDRGPRSALQNRDVGRQYGTEVSAAVREWRKSHPMQ